MDPDPPKKTDFEEQLERINRAGAAAAYHAAEAARKLREYADELKRREGR